MEYVLGGAAIVASLAGTAASIYSSSANKPKSETPMPPKDKGAEEAARQEAALIKRRKGAMGSILTSPLGVGGSPTTQKTTLGD